MAKSVLRRYAEKLRAWASHDIVAAIERQTAAITLFNSPDRIISLVYEGREIHFYLPNGDYDYIQNQIVVSRTFYEERHLSQVRKRFDLHGAHVLDVGGNIGNHAVYFTAICGAATCVSFEPNPHAAAILERNAELNGGRIEVRRMALSDKGGQLAFSRWRPLNIGGASYAEQEAGTIQAARLDDLNIQRVDFVKIDVEGMANKVLSGGSETLERLGRPPLFIEILPDEMETCRETLEAMRYQQTAALGQNNYFFERS